MFATNRRQETIGWIISLHLHQLEANQTFRWITPQTVMGVTLDKSFCKIAKEVLWIFPFDKLGSCHHSKQITLFHLKAFKSPIESQACCFNPQNKERTNRGDIYEARLFSATISCLPFTRCFHSFFRDQLQRNGFYVK